MTGSNSPSFLLKNFGQKCNIARDVNTTLTFFFICFANISGYNALFTKYLKTRKSWGHFLTILIPINTNANVYPPGFLLRAEAENDRHVGTWYIPYLADTSYLSESQYLHCNNKLQSAVTHSGQTSSMWVVSFQWRPPHQFYRWVTFR